MSSEPIALRLADEAQRLGRPDLADLLRLRHELGVLTYGEALSRDTEALSAHYGCEVADVMIYRSALFERDGDVTATEHDLGRALRLVPIGIVEAIEAAAMTEMEIRRRGGRIEH